MTQVPKLLLLDASCLLNLYATGRLHDIASVLPYRLGVADYVLEQEALYVWRSGPGEAREERVPVDLSSMVEAGIIQVLRLEHQVEEACFVDLAALVDDGEAITGALACCRGCAVATDDRKARRVLANRAPTVPLVSTLDLLREWGEKALVVDAEMRAAMLAMESGASYVPGDREPLYSWWRTIVYGQGLGR